MKYPLMRHNLTRDDLDTLVDYLKQDDPKLTSGPKVEEFEAQWSKWLGVRYSLFVNSGASANLLSMALLKLKYPDGGEVIVPPLTWVSDISSVLQHGFKPVFVDIDPHTLAIDTQKTIAALSEKTRAVFITHVQGFNGLSDKLLEALDRRGILLIEDVCESHGASHNGKRLGSLGWVSNFSFYYAHHMTTVEGGMICTNDAQVYQKARMLRAHGMVRESNSSEVRDQYTKSYPDLNPDFIFAFPAYNVRNTEIGAILGLSQLSRLDQNIKRRIENQDRFYRNIDARKYRTDFNFKGASNYAFNLVMRNPDMDFAERLMRAMRKAQIEFRRGSAGGGNQLRQPYVQAVLPEKHYLDFPQVEHIHFFGFYIGNFPDLTFAQIDEIVSVLNAVE